MRFWNVFLFMNNNTLFDPHSFAQNLKRPLPGTNAHCKLIDPLRIHALEQHRNLRKAGVLLLILKDTKTDYIVLMRRSDGPKDKHAGQISFPGGKMEKSDPDVIHAALRETEEEIGVHRSKISVLGCLSPVKVQVSRYIITPVVGWTTYSEFTLQKDEVQALILLPLAQLLDPSAIQKHGTVTLPNGTQLVGVPHFLYLNHIIWGATAMILSEFRDIILSSPSIHPR